MIDKSKSLPSAILNIIEHKHTELAFSGEYFLKESTGTYLCRRCGLALFSSHGKFHSGCGWPSFDESIKDTIKHQADPDGQRTEIVCARCNAHLGHIFHGERLTPLNTRYCVNSLSLDYVATLNVSDSEEAILAAGCFWGVEYYFSKLPGVLKTEVGYIGGHLDNPSYEQVCQGDSEHVEAVRVVYDPKLVSFEKIVKYFFEIHDPTQKNGQGPDIGEQYLSIAFYYNEEQRRIIKHLIKMLEEQGYVIATKTLPVSPFWQGESYHQGYYEKNHKMPYCHQYVKRFI
ncbi:MAG: bifunctional methionine sulfoxide reductase B/A protein [Proteobacteria bacterium]|nr:bifunctional methionine sulfoxide reductase B/A protein [Pseudomonadota bacterium]